MADSDARTGFGAILRMENRDTPGDYIDLMGIKGITPPEMSRDVHDTTTMQSPGGWREFIGGLKDGGEVSFSANFLPRDPTQGQTSGFMSEFDRDSCESRGNWEILLPACPGEEEVAFRFAGIVTGQSGDIPMDDVMTFEGTIKVSGRPQLVLTGETAT